MRRLVLLLCLLAIALPARAAQAAPLRFPKTGAHAFLVDLPRGWRTRTDTRGGLLLIPPAERQHAMLYLAFTVDDTLRGAPLSAIATQAGNAAGVGAFDKEEPARITDTKGGVHRGTAFYGRIPEARGLYRRAKIVVIPLGPNAWAQAWIVTQPGMNAVEYAKLDAVLNSVVLAAE
jgi:hypothetical protein